MTGLLAGIGLRGAMRRGALHRSALVALACAITTMTVLGAQAFPRVAGQEQRRAAAVVIRDGPAASSLRFRTTQHEFRGRVVTITQLGADGPSPARPVGLSALPQPGEVLLSPALADMVDGDDRLDAWFPKHRGALPPSAVGSAGQLLAYWGTEPAAFDPNEHPRAGDLVDPVFALGNASSSRLSLLGLVLFAVVPSVVLLATCVQLGARAQRQRTIALRMLGVSRGGVSVVSSVELLPAALAGTFFGWLGFLGALHVVNVLPIVDRRYFAGDAAPGPATTALCLVAAMGVVIAVSVTSARAAGRLVRSPRMLLARRLASRRLAALTLASVGLLGVAYLRREPSDPVLTAAVVVFGLGLPTTTILLVQGAARRAAHLFPSLSWLLAMRKLETDPARAVRVAGVAALAVYAFGIAQPVTQALESTGVSWVDEATAGQPGLLAAFVTGPEREHLRLADPPPGVLAVLPVVDFVDDAGRPTSALVATCDQYAALVRTPLEDCTTSPTRLGGRPGDAAGPQVIASIGVFATDVADWLVDPATVEAAVRNADPRAAIVEVRPTLDAWEEAQAWLVRGNPGHRMENSYQTNARGGTVGLWLLLGVAVASSTILLAGGVLAVEAAVLRRGELFALRAVGVRRITLAGAQLLEGWFAGLVAVGIAVSGALAATVVYWHMLRDDPFPALGPYVLAAGMALLAVTALAAMTALVQPRRLAPT